MQKIERKPGKVTLYLRGEFFGNIHKIEAREFGFAIGAYAQYSSAVGFEFVGKGQRNARGSVQSYRPDLLVLEGWGHPDPAGVFGAETTSGGVTTRTSRHSACSEEWAREFDSMIAEYITKSGARARGRRLPRAQLARARGARGRAGRGQGGRITRRVRIDKAPKKALEF